jgi:hypothetical protein
MEERGREGGREKFEMKERLRGYIEESRMVTSKDMHIESKILNISKFA